MGLKPNRTKLIGFEQVIHIILVQLKYQTPNTHLKVTVNLSPSIYYNGQIFFRPILIYILWVDISVFFNFGFGWFGFELFKMFIPKTQIHTRKKFMYFLISNMVNYKTSFSESKTLLDYYNMSRCIVDKEILEYSISLTNVRNRTECRRD